jgi:hypothetical protein
MIPDQSELSVISYCKLNTDNFDGVVKTLHLLRCRKFSIIATYPSTPK